MQRETATCFILKINMKYLKWVSVIKQENGKKKQKLGKSNTVLKC